MVCAQSPPTALQWWIVGILSALLSALKQGSTQIHVPIALSALDIPPMHFTRRNSVPCSIAINNHISKKARERMGMTCPIKVKIFAYS